MSVRVYSFAHVDVFTQTALKGNPLAVFTTGEGLSDAEMQQIAGELNLAETVFVFPPRTHDSVATLRIFTPRRELTFAGHPTIGAVTVLLRDLGIAHDRFSVDEGVGPIPIVVERAGDVPMVWLTTPPVTIVEEPDRGAVAASLALDIDDLDPTLPAVYASAGSAFLFVGLRDAARVDRAQMRLAALPKAPVPHVIGTYLYAHSGANAYARMFAPQSGIAEDPATGSAAGPLVASLIAAGALPDGDGEYAIVQGATMGRESRIAVRVRGSGENRTIAVGGTAVPLIRGELRLPR